GNGNIGVTINAGSIVQGGTGSGSAGVAILGGASNTLLNLGTITTASSPDAAHYPFNTYRFNTAAGIESTQLASTGNYQTTSLMTDNSALLAAFIGTDMSKQQGTAIFANAGTLTLTNDGDIYGSIVLDGATLDLINKGVIVSGSQLNFGSDGTLMLGSGSLMTPGGGGFVATTNLTGNLREMPGSNYLVNLDLTNNTASNFNVSGFASVAGTVDLDLLSTNAAAPGAHAESIITAAGGVTNNGLTLAPPQSAVASFSLAYQPDDVLLDYDINYAPTTGDVLNHNDLAFGDYVGRIQTAGSTPKLASFMSTVFAIPTVADLKGFYDRFSPDTSVALSSAALLSNMQFSDAMLNCHADNSFTQQSGGCNWGTIGTQNSGQTASSSSDGFAQSALDFAAGFEHKIGNGLTSIGAAVHYANGSLSDSDAATTLTGGTLSAGFSASHVLNDGVVLSADLFGGDGHYESGRTVGYPAVTTQATGTQELSFIGTHLRADRYFGNSINSVTPYLDLGLTQVNVGELDESGAGIFDENVAAHHDVLPTVAFGARFEKQFHRKATQFRLALDASATQLLGNAQSLTTATLAGAPAGVTPFVLTNTMDRTYFGLTPSLEITHNDKLGVRISGSYNFSASTHSLGTYVQFTTKLGGGSL
ncbi:MAG TPA: autotransporter domain-containing protein, partial [Candidatus Acidoferrum sp.]|nr:autotransporter domain-containing protein [Candidatus Acidoferrum sp.]